MSRDEPPDDDLYGDDYRDELADLDASGIDDCAMCGGPLVQLGLLGRRLHYRCRNCGMECSRETAPPAFGPSDDGSEESPF